MRPHCLAIADRDVADGHIALHVQQADVLTGQQPAEGDLGAHLGHATRVDKHVQRKRGQQGGVFDGDRAAPFDNVGERRQVGSLLGTGAGLVQRLGGTAGLHVGDGGDLHAGDAADLGDEPEAHLPCADQPDADRPA